MPQQIVRQRSRGFICVNAHPGGCAQNVEDQIRAIAEAKPYGASGPRRAVVIGSSTGYGLSARISLAWGFGAKTAGVFFERPPDGKKTATAGYYNSAAFHRLARAEGLWAESINGDAFSDEIKAETAKLIRHSLGQVDLVVYSLASPRRVNPRSGQTVDSALKPIGSSYTGKTVDLGSGDVVEATIEPASPDEIAQTVAVMGGEDWRWWIEALLDERLLADGARTVSFSYVGPELTWPIYRDGTIGVAKKDLCRTAADLNAALARKLGGGAFVSVNKAVVTQASSAIPVVPLYISLLFRVMKERGLHEGCVGQMRRLCFDHLADGKTPATDPQGLVRLDDLEMRDDIQAAVAELWPKVTADNLSELSDFDGFRRDFSRLFGFGVDGVDYDTPVETDIPL